MWWWVLIWVLLVLIAVVYLAMRVWGVWGQVKELRDETVRASEMVSALEVQLDRLGDSPAPPPQASVFDDPRALRRVRERTRTSIREEKRARRDARMPSWARGRAEAD